MISGTGEDDARQLGSELRERLRDAERLRQELGGSSGSRELGGVINNLRGMTDGIMEGEAQTAASLKAAVIDPLRQLELELSKRLREQLGRGEDVIGQPRVRGAGPGTVEASGIEQEKIGTSTGKLPYLFAAEQSAELPSVEALPNL